MNEKNEGYWDDTSYALFFYIIPLRFIFGFSLLGNKINKVI